MTSNIPVDWKEELYDDNLLDKACDRYEVEDPLNLTIEQIEETIDWLSHQHYTD